MSCRTYIIPPAIVAGVVAGAAMWLVFIAFYKLLLKRLRTRGSGGVEEGEVAATNNNDLRQIAAIPRARLASKQPQRSELASESNSNKAASLKTTELSTSSVVKVNPSSSSSPSGSGPGGASSSTAAAAAGNSRGSPKGSALRDSGRESGSPSVSPASSDMEMGAIAAAPTKR